jgi:tRNA G18 (ribose-2'-O)-methylase SpoU
MQLTHYNSIFKKRRFPITIICDGLTSPYNIGGIFRIADAFGVESIMFIHSDGDLGKRYKKTARATEKYIPYSIHSDFNGIYRELSDKQYHFFALEISTSSKPIKQIEINTKHPVALIIGGENFGISEEVLDQIPSHVHVEMYGNNTSMNVVQSAAIALYEITNILK